jgi:PTH1 family peptidyl-tRNA hydrolase
LAVLRERLDITSGRLAFGGEVYDAGLLEGGGTERRVMLFEPHTYMNRSGEAVKGLTSFFKAEISDVLVVLDDMALPLGMLRARASGSPGGHNGLKDVLRLLGTQDVPRLRIGIGAPPPQMEAADYVLGQFDTEELKIITPVIGQAADAVEDWIKYDIQRVMDKYNRKTDT